MQGLDMSRYHIMGIINTTPDSFSDGGDHSAAETATSAALEMASQGAAILDVVAGQRAPVLEAVGFDEESRYFACDQKAESCWTYRERVRGIPMS